MPDMATHSANRWGRVLFVNDEPADRSAFANLVGTAGWEVELAASAPEAVALAQEAKYCAVVTDLCLGGTAGCALLKQLQALQPETACFVSCDAEDELQGIPEALRNGLDGVLRKPWDNNGICGTIRERVQSRSEPPLGGADPIQNVASGPLQVLLVEDNPGDAAFFKAALERSFTGLHDVSHAGSLRQALEWLDERAFDVAVVDLGLPDARGLDVIVALQARARETAFIVHSGRTDDRTALDALQSGVQDYLIKGQADGLTITRSIRFALERKRFERRLARWAYFDGLTGLANRTLFHQEVAQALARARRKEDRFALLFIDVDHFKSINDSFGHHVGDLFLQIVADRLRGSVREGDVVARFGGDEFAVLASSIEPGCDAEAVARRILTALRQPLDLHGRTHPISVSIGIAVYPQAGTTRESLLCAADQAMYVAKRDGRDRFSVVPGCMPSPTVVSQRS